MFIILPLLCLKCTNDKSEMTSIKTYIYIYFVFFWGEECIHTYNLVLYIGRVICASMLLWVITHYKIIYYMLWPIAGHIYVIYIYKQ